jgi:hypothetical protein
MYCKPEFDKLSQTFFTRARDNGIVILESDFEMKYDKKLKTLSFKNTQNQSVAHMRYFKFEKTSTHPEPFFNSDFEDLLNLPRDIPSDGVNPKKDGFINSFAKFTQNPGIRPEDQRANWERFQKEWEINLKNIEIEWRTVTNYKYLFAGNAETRNFNPDYGKPYSFVFKNVSPHVRQDFLVRASFTGLTSDQYLGFTNESYTPIKYYQIDYSDQPFWIELFELDSYTPYEIGRKEHLLIEAVTLSGEKTPLN